jgi:hypothetical protein
VDAFPPIQIMLATVGRIAPEHIGLVVAVEVRDRLDGPRCGDGRHCLGDVPAGLRPDRGAAAVVSRQTRSEMKLRFDVVRALAHAVLQFHVRHGVRDGQVRAAVAVEVAEIEEEPQERGLQGGRQDLGLRHPARAAHVTADRRPATMADHEVKVAVTVDVVLLEGRRDVVGRDGLGEAEIPVGIAAIDQQRRAWSVAGSRHDDFPRSVTVDVEGFDAVPVNPV